MGFPETSSGMQEDEAKKEKCIQEDTAKKAVRDLYMSTGKCKTICFEEED